MTKRTGGLLDARQIDVLQEDLRRELEHHPGWCDLWNLRGLLRAYRGAPEEACRDFREAMTRNRRYWTAQWSLCWAELLAGNNPGAGVAGKEDSREILQPSTLLRVVRNLLQDVSPEPSLEPDEASLAFSLLCVAAARRDEDAMGRAIESLRKLQPGLMDLLEIAGLGHGGNPDARALAELGRPQMLNPGYADLFARAARIESITGRDDEALRLYALAALLRGSHAFFLLRRAEILSRGGDSDGAISCCRKAAELEPDWFAPHVALGYELSLRGMAAEARDHLETATRLEPGYPDVLYQYGLLLQAEQRNEESIEAMKAALRVHPSYHVARVALANLLFESGRQGEALPHYELLLEEGIESSLLLGRLGYAAHAAGYRSRAEELFLDAISRDRNRPEVLCLYGLFLRETDRRMEARAVWDRALAADPPPDLRERLESLVADAFPPGVH